MITATDTQEHGEERPSLWFLEKLSQLANSSSFDSDKVAEIEKSLSELTMTEAIELCRVLDANQLDLIDSGLKYTQTDISKKIKLICGIKTKQP